MFDVAFTGPAKEFSRSQLTDMAKFLGMKVRSSVCSKTTALIGDFDTVCNGSRKTEAAMNRQLPIFSYEEFVLNFEKAIRA